MSQQSHTPETAAQSLSVKRAQVDFHNFASLGEPQRALAAYADENFRRGCILKGNLDFCPSLSPFVEIGANAGHTSYLLANDFSADGFALDLSADALRHGQFLKTAWNLSRSPILTAGDATRLPFRDNSIAFAMTFQTLSQFQDFESVFREVHRVLAPGGVYYFAEEPIRRKFTLRLHRAPYPERMKPWEKWMYSNGLLDFIARDVIGAQQEESFGIRQNHRHYLIDWLELIGKYFPESRVLAFPRAKGWANQAVINAFRLVPGYTDARSAKYLGGTIAALCQKEGVLPDNLSCRDAFACPDCSAPLPFSDDVLVCPACSYRAPKEEGVYNLLSSKLKEELYPGARPDTLDFSKPGHEAGLLQGFHELEGDFGSKYRWIAASASARLSRVRSGPQVLRVQGYAPSTAKLDLKANGAPLGSWKFDRPGLFVLEAPLPEAPEYTIEIHASPTFTEPDGARTLSVNLSLLRLQPPSD